MDVRFRDISSGIVEARAVVRLSETILLNEITILNKDGNIEIEFPQKTFKGKNGKVQHLDIIMFETENAKNLFLIELKEEYYTWRKQQKKVRVYDSE
jgi:hypothetical protein